MGTQTASTQCWWVAQALRSHSRCRLVDYSDEMSPCRASLVHELLQWLTVGWSRVANRAVRPERSLRLLSVVRIGYFCRVVDNKNGWTYQKAKFVDKHFSPRYNRFSCFLLQVPQTFTSLRPPNYVVLHDYNASFQSSSFFHLKLVSTVVRGVII